MKNKILVLILAMLLTVPVLNCTVNAEGDAQNAYSQFSHLVKQ